MRLWTCNGTIFLYHSLNENIICTSAQVSLLVGKYCMRPWATQAIKRSTKGPSTENECLTPNKPLPDSSSCAINWSFYSWIPSCQAFDLEWGSGWPCCDRDQYLVSMIKKSTGNLHLKCSKVCIITRSPLASPLFKGLATKRATVKWTILIIFSFCQHTVGEVFHLWFELWDPPLLLQPWDADTCAQEGCSWHPH